MKYKALKSSYGFYKGSYVEKGQIVDFDSNDNPPENLFKCLEPKPVITKVEIPVVKEEVIEVVENTVEVEKPRRVGRPKKA